MSSLSALSGGHSERPPPLGPRERGNMEAGIDLFATATVTAVAVEAPPPVVEPDSLNSGSQANRLTRPDGVEPDTNAPITGSLVNRRPDDVEPFEMVTVGDLAESADAAAADAPPVLDLTAVDAPSDDEESLFAEAWAWMKDNVHWYAISFAVHVAVFAVLLFVLGRIEALSGDDGATFQPVDTALLHARQLNPFDISGGTPEDPTVLNQDVLRMPEIRAVPAEFNDKSEQFQKEGGGRTSNSGGPDFGGNGGFDVHATGPGASVTGAGGLGSEHGISDRLGSGGSGDGFAGRGKGNRSRLGALGGTKNTEAAVAAALNWFNRHRNNNGSWSLSRFPSHCTGNPCTSPGTAESDTAATALALLPFLGAGETHKGKGPYQETVKQALFFLMRRQAANGDLSAGSQNQMYAHALGALALCEAYGMTKDQKVGDAAQKAVFFIEAAQNRGTGGWRYVPGAPDGGDTSVLGWQMMALRSAQLAGLAVNTLTMENAKRWLNSVSKGSMHGLFAYQPYKNETPTMTAIGMLSWQYLGMRQDDPAMTESKHYLLQHLPDNGERSTYYWYYATQAMHNMTGPSWDTWNRKMRRVLVESQCREGCASGSWDPLIPTQDSWSEQGGRIVTTSFSTLTLEVYYRYLPLYNLHSSASDPPPAVVPDTEPP